MTLDAVRLGEVAARCSPRSSTGSCEREQVERDDAGRREHHGDGHRLAERAAEAEHRRPRRCRSGRTGSTAIRIISQRVAPSASAASSWRRGVCRKISRQMAVMIGRIMTASTMADGEDRAAGAGDRAGEERDPAEVRR